MALPTPSRFTFSEWIGEHRRGQADLDLADALSDVVQAALATGKPGTLTLTITVNPIKYENQVEVVDKIGTKIPTDIEPKLYYVHPDGGLTRRDPTQPAFPFDAATVTTPEGMTIDLATGEVTTKENPG